MITAHVIRFHDRIGELLEKRVSSAVTGRRKRISSWQSFDLRRHDVLVLENIKNTHTPTRHKEIEKKRGREQRWRDYEDERSVSKPT